MINPDDSKKQESSEQPTGSKDDKALVVYKFLLQLRDLDNKLMWTRVNVMFLIQGILFSFLASTFPSLIGKYPLIIILMSFFGLASAYFLWCIAKGGSFWVDYWEKKLGEIEKDAIGNFNIFREHTTTDKETREQAKKEGYKSTREAIVFLSFTFFYSMACFSYLHNNSCGLIGG